MYRISSSAEHAKFNHFNGLNEKTQSDLQGKMLSGRSITSLRDDPAGAAQSIRFQSKADRLSRYEKNIENAINNYAATEGYMAQATEIMQRVRELTVQSANGTYSKEQTAMMGNEVNELLEELAVIANAKDGNGLSLFSGTRNNTDAFRFVKGFNSETGKPVITNAEYTGNNNSALVEYSDGISTEKNFLGNNVFWSDNQEIRAINNANGFIVGQDSSVVINNVEVALKAGDSIQSVIEKINASSANVKASLDPIENNLVLSTTTPSQIWVDDVNNGTVLSDLGLTKAGFKGPNNLAATTQSYGGSMFDTIISVRDAMLSGDRETLGSKSLASLDNAMNALNTQRATLGARESRLNFAVQRVRYENETYVGWDDSLRGLDFAKAATELSQIETMIKANYAMGSKILNTTLMDFVR